MALETQGMFGNIAEQVKGTVHGLKSKYNILTNTLRGQDKQEYVKTREQDVENMKRNIADRVKENRLNIGKEITQAWKNLPYNIGMFKKTTPSYSEDDGQKQETTGQMKPLKEAWGELKDIGKTAAQYTVGGALQRLGKDKKEIARDLIKRRSEVISSVLQDETAVPQGMQKFKEQIKSLNPFRKYVDITKTGAKVLTRIVGAADPIETPAEKGMKDMVLKDYNWKGNIHGIIKTLNIEDMSPIISEGLNYILYPQQGKTEYGGRIRAHLGEEGRLEEGEMRNTTFDLMSSVTAHEIIHYMDFALGITQDNPAQFNSDWENAKVTTSDDLRGRMEDIDKTLDEKYIGIDEDGRALERFAWLGMNMNKDWDIGIPDELTEYYAKVFEQNIN